MFFEGWKAPQPFTSRSRCAFDASLFCDTDESGKCRHSSECYDAMTLAPEVRDRLNEQYALREIESLLCHVSPAERRNLGERLQKTEPETGSSTASPGVGTLPGQSA